jgi:hypothetical protein
MLGRAASIADTAAACAAARHGRALLTRQCIAALTKQLPFAARRRRTLASLGEDVLRASDAGIVTNALATACAAPPDSPPEPAAARRRVSGGAPDAPDIWRWTEAKVRRNAHHLAASGPHS